MRPPACIGRLILIAGMPTLARPQPAPVQHKTRVFLDAYARGDLATVLRCIDPARIVAYGSDAAELVHGASGVAKLLAADQALWHHQARIGSMRQVTLVQSGSLASIFFQATFQVGEGPVLPVRFAMVWQRHGRTWLLVQSSNTVPTQHQSAAELLRPSTP